ncbi:putative serine protease family S33 [Phytophthora cinnamomi]|uniref:putative serine protease family S33 n=1 Tax=Phytophthora cinnamomi TaxID=4785 RepID=UPI00355A6240|nr:putative serine protease family S33 [Phytophthora cinnamomi]
MLSSVATAASKESLLDDRRRRADLGLRAAGRARGHGSPPVMTKRIVAGKSELNEFMTNALQPILDSYTPTWWTNSHIQCFLTFLAELEDVVDVPAALRATSIREFDRHVYMKMHGYADLEAYWRVNNPMRDVDNLSKPLLCINALDDPVCTKETILYHEFRRKPNAMLLATGEGSHCAFFEGNFQLKSWCNEAAMTYLDRLREFNALSVVAWVLVVELSRRSRRRLRRRRR